MNAYNCSKASGGPNALVLLMGKLMLWQIQKCTNCGSTEDGQWADPTHGISDCCRVKQADPSPWNRVITHGSSWHDPWWGKDIVRVGVFTNTCVGLGLKMSFIAHTYLHRCRSLFPQIIQGVFSTVHELSSTVRIQMCACQIHTRYKYSLVGQFFFLYLAE